MNQYLSEKIKVLSFFSIILVLYIHSGFHEYPHEIAGMTFNIYLQEFISGMIGRLAVPLFFAISGYLFFLNTDKGIQTVVQKMKKRVRTLLIPYLIACLFLPVFYLLMEAIPGTGGFVNSESPFSENLKLPIGQLLVFLFFDSGSGSPCAFHLWFLRDLIIIVAVSPLLYWIRNLKIIGVVVCAALYGLTLLDIPYLPTFGVFWFMFGAYFLNDLSRVKYRNLLTVLFLALSVVELGIPDWGGHFLKLKIPIILVGLISVWLWYDRLVPESFELKNHRFLSTACGFTFFIYLYHEPTINIVRKLLVIPFGHNSFSFAFSYLLSPWLFAVLFILVGMLLKRYVSPLYGVLVGGR